MASAGKTFIRYLDEYWVLTNVNMLHGKLINILSRWRDIYHSFINPEKSTLIYMLIVYFHKLNMNILTYFTISVLHHLKSISKWPFLVCYKTTIWPICSTLNGFIYWILSFCSSYSIGSLDLYQYPNSFS